jgi:predicted transcriptional regulator with HTH domain
MIAIETENFGWNTFVLILLVLLLHAKFDLLTYASSDPLSTILWIVGYFAFGLGWSFLKWYAKLSTIARKIKESKKETLNVFGYEDLEAVPKNNESKFYNSLVNSLESNGIKIYRNAGNSRAEFMVKIKEVFPELKYDKAKIIAWIIYWPFSLVATALNDPIKRFANYLYEAFSGVFEDISTNIKDRVLKDM